MNKIELNIIVCTLGDYKVIKSYLKGQEIKILGEFFSVNDVIKKIYPNYFCNIEVLVSLDEYEGLSNLDIDIGLILNTNLPFPNMEGLNNLPFVKQYMIDVAPRIQKQTNQSDKGERMNKIDQFLQASDNFMVKMFRKHPDIIDNYVESEALTINDKIKDIDRMIEYFEGDLNDLETQQYEECALLLDIKNRIIKYEKNKTKEFIKRDSSNVSGGGIHSV